MSEPRATKKQRWLLTLVASKHGTTTADLVAGRQIVDRYATVDEIGSALRRMRTRGWVLYENGEWFITSLGRAAADEEEATP